MLNIIELNSWSDFEKIIEGQLLYETQNLRSGDLLFRGQVDSTWKLETTLERYAGRNLSAQTYHRMIEKTQEKIETFTGRRWELPPYNEFHKIIQERPSNYENPAYTYMTYLRHFGFPSPLLDWTHSPFIAAFFAFRDVSSTAESVAIYQFHAASDLLVTGAGLLPDIYPIIVSARNNKRHELQQSVYTVCLKVENHKLIYTSHEDPNMLREDGITYVTKYIIPTSERVIALHSLNAYNINAYSLFGTEESLLETLFMNAYKIKKISQNIFQADEDEPW